MKSPTQSQRAFAERLGIDIGPGTTRAELTRLIDHALARQRIDGLRQTGVRVAAHGDDVLAMVGGGERGEHPTAAYQKAAQAFISQAEIGKSSIVTDGRLLLVAEITDDWRLQVNDLSADRRTVWLARAMRWKGDSYVPCVSRLHHPPIGFLHQQLFRWGSAAQRDFVTTRLPTEAVIETPYGGFWKEEMVAALVEEYRSEREAKIEAARQRTQKRKQAAQERATPRTKHCAVCGQTFVDHDPFHHTHRCKPCQTNKKVAARIRYCTDCGRTFVRGDGGRWSCRACQQGALATSGT